MQLHPFYSPPAAPTNASSCRERRLRHSAARALYTTSVKSVASVLPTHTYSSPVPRQNTTTHTPAAAQEEVTPQPVLAAPTSHWSYDGSYDGKHMAGKFASNTTHRIPLPNGNPPQFVVNHGARPPDSRQQSSLVLSMPDDVMMDLLQPQQETSRGNRKWPYIRVRPTQAVGSQAGFANKMLRMHGRVLVECSGDEGAFSAIRVLRCTRSMLQGEEAHMLAWLPSMRQLGTRPRTPAAAAASAARRSLPHTQRTVSMQFGRVGKGQNRELESGEGLGMQTRRRAVLAKGPNKHLVLLVRSGSIPRSLAARQIAQGQQNQRAQQFQLHVRKLLAGPIIPSSTLKVPKACPPKWIASHILHHFLPSHSHASRSLSSSIGTPRSARAGCSSACSSVRGSGRGGPSSISTDRGSASGGASGSRDSSRSKRGDPRQNEAPTRLTQGRLRGGQGGVLCLSSLGPIAAVNSLKGVALARRELHMQGRDVCVVLDAVGVDVDSAREGSTAMNRFMVMECALGDPTRQLNVRGSTWLRSTPAQGPGVAHKPR
uniref:Uncharacterized protein n=1 Tax=Dunaliella tertiolecta TaxID=3047 RepID=A0A7S3QK84_DUNTE